MEHTYKEQRIELGLIRLPATITVKGDWLDGEIGVCIADGLSKVARVVYRAPVHKQHKVVGAEHAPLGDYWVYLTLHDVQPMGQTFTVDVSELNNAEAV